MSEYDDTTDCSGTLVYAGYWCAAEPNSCRWVQGPIFSGSYTIFLECADCSGRVGPPDTVVGDFGELHCVFCGSDNLK